jgi:N-glycosylase/DNA lyase
VKRFKVESAFLSSQSLEEFWNVFFAGKTLEQKIDIVRQFHELRIQGTGQKISDEKIQRQIAQFREWLEEMEENAPVSKATK